MVFVFIDIIANCIICFYCYKLLWYAFLPQATQYIVYFLWGNFNPKIKNPYLQYLCFWLTLSLCVIFYRSSHNLAILTKETRDLLTNLTVGSSDIQPPGIFHYLPHIMSKPHALTPRTKVSNGRMGGKQLILIFTYTFIPVHFNSQLCGHMGSSEEVCGVMYLCVAKWTQ